MPGFAVYKLRMIDLCDRIQVRSLSNASRIVKDFRHTIGRWRNFMQNAVTPLCTLHS